MSREKVTRAYRAVDPFGVFFPDTGYVVRRENSDVVGASPDSFLVIAGPGRDTMLARLQSLEEVETEWTEDGLTLEGAITFPLDPPDAPIEEVVVPSEEAVEVRAASEEEAQAGEVPKPPVDEEEAPPEVPPVEAVEVEKVVETEAEAPVEVMPEITPGETVADWEARTGLSAQATAQDPTLGAVLLSMISALAGTDGLDPSWLTIVPRAQDEEETEVTE
jgi:hypothetical protein